MSDAPISADLFARAQRVIPGGVNSPVRAFRAVGGTPRFMVSGSGAYLTDADGRYYVDLVVLGSDGPGARPPGGGRRGTAGRASGLSFGTPTLGEIELAEEIIARVNPASPAGRSAPLEQVRLVTPVPRRRCRPSGWRAAPPGGTGW